MQIAFAHLPNLTAMYGNPWLHVFIKQSLMLSHILNQQAYILTGVLPLAPGVISHSSSF